MTNIVLDASALIALIFQEKGTELVERHLPQAIISAVNLSEVVAFMIRKGHESQSIVNLLMDLAIPVETFDEEQSYIAGQLIATTNAKGLSFGDRACIALAIQKKHPVLTADRVWGSLSLDVLIQIIR